MRDTAEQGFAADRIQRTLLRRSRFRGAKTQRWTDPHAAGEVVQALGGMEHCMSSDGHALPPRSSRCKRFSSWGMRRMHARMRCLPMCGGRCGRCWPAAPRGWVGTSRPVRMGMWNGSGTTPVGTGCVPQCAWVQVERWLARQQARLLACEHYHVIFTMPHELNALWLANVTAMTNLLFASAHDTVLELLDDREIPGGEARDHRHAAHLEPDVAAASAHSLFGHRRGFEPSGPVGGGQERVVCCRMRVVRALFRGKLLAAMRQGVAHGTLKPPEGKSRQQVENLLNKLGRMKWNVHIRERYPHGRGVLVYLARYLRGGPLANRRLLSCDGAAGGLPVRRAGQGPRGPGHPTDDALTARPVHRALAPPCAASRGRARARLGAVWPHPRGSPGPVPAAVGQGRDEVPPP